MKSTMMSLAAFVMLVLALHPKRILLIAIAAVITPGLAFATLLSNLPGGQGGAVTGFGNDPTHATYFQQSFIAPEGLLDSFLFPIIGPAEMRVLITDTDIQGRPQSVLFESADIFPPVNNTSNQSQFPVFFFGGSISGGNASWLNWDSGSREQDFASPVRTDPNQDQPVWNPSGSDFAICLAFDSASCGQEKLITDSLTNSGWVADAITVDIGGLALTAGTQYSVVWDGAIIDGIPEPSALTLAAFGLLGLAYARRRT